MKFSFFSSKNIFFKTYLLQFIQVLYMLLLAFGVPYYIGLKDYGIYAALYAIPGFFHGMIETFLMLFFMDYDFRKSTMVYFARTTTLLLVCVFLTSIYFFSMEMSLCASMLFLSFMLKSLISALSYNEIDLSLNKIVISEFITLTIYIIVFVLFVFLSKKNIYLPISMVVLANVGTFIYLVKFIEFDTKLNQQVINKKSLMPLLFSRMYEDSFLTISPLFLMQIFGSVYAAQFRLGISIIKGFLKLFPFKYELVIRTIKTGQFRFDIFLKSSILFSVTGVVVYFGLLFFKTSTLGIMLPITLLIGPIVSILVLYPILSKIKKHISILVLLLILVVYSSAYFGNIHHFMYSFIALTVMFYIYLLFILTKIKGQINFL